MSQFQLSLIPCRPMCSTVRSVTFAEMGHNRLIKGIERGLRVIADRQGVGELFPFCLCASVVIEFEIVAVVKLDVANC